MKLTSRLLSILATVLLIGLNWSCSKTAPSDVAVSFFDGKTLNGWNVQDAEKKWWRVNDGVIEGGSLEENVEHNTFITLPNSYQNFELTLKLRFINGEGEGFKNSGVQIRSQRLPNHHEMIGYQVDAGTGWWGKLYDESRRRIVVLHLT